MRFQTSFVAFFGLFLLFSCVTPDPNVTLGKEYYNLGNTYFELKKYADAMRAYKTALTYQPQLKIATMNLARAMAEQGDADGALTQLSPAIDQDPDNLTLLKLKAWLLYKKGDKPAACELWLKLAEKLPGDADTQYNAGVAAAAVDGKIDLAIKALKRWNELDGKTAPPLKLLADLEVQQKDWVAAEKVYRLLSTMIPETDLQNPVIQLALAQTLVNEEEYGKAVEAYKKAIDVSEALKKPSGELWFAMAKVQLVKIEDYPTAWKSFLSAWKKDYKDPAGWKALVDTPDLKDKIRLQADLYAAKILQEEAKTTAPTPSTQGPQR